MHHRSVIVSPDTWKCSSSLPAKCWRSLCQQDEAEKRIMHLKDTKNIFFTDCYIIKVLQRKGNKWKSASRANIAFCVCVCVWKWYKHKAALWCWQTNEVSAPHTCPLEREALLLRWKAATSLMTGSNKTQLIPTELFACWNLSWINSRDKNHYPLWISLDSWINSSFSFALFLLFAEVLHKYAGKACMIT